MLGGTRGDGGCHDYLSFCGISSEYGSLTCRLAVIRLAKSLPSKKSPVALQTVQSVKSGIAFDLAKQKRPAILVKLRK